MFKTFSEQHPWFSRTAKKQLWNLLNVIGKEAYTIQIINSGLKFIINPKDNNVGKYIFLSNYEKETVLFASKYLMSGDQVLDIGANIGYFSLLFSDYVGENGEVHSFEPSRREFLHLCENVKINHVKNIFLNQVALSNQNGYVKMNILDEAYLGAFNSINEITHQKVNLEKIHTETIRTMKIDDYLLLFSNLKPCLVKIDVEGFEKQVLQGMHSILSSPNAPCIIIEICEGTHQDKQIGTEALMYYIKEFGYKLYSPDKNGNLKPFQLGSSLNCIAIIPSHFTRLNIRGIKVVKSI